MSEEYLSLLKDLNHALSYLSLADLTDVDEQIIKTVVAERLELESRKDKLVVGSEWVCVAPCVMFNTNPDVDRYGDGYKYFEVGEVVVINKYLSDYYDVVVTEKVQPHYKWFDDEKHFIVCFKPKGEK